MDLLFQSQYEPIKCNHFVLCLSKHPSITHEAKITISSSLPCLSKLKFPVGQHKSTVLKILWPLLYTRVNGLKIHLCQLFIGQLGGGTWG